MPLHMIFRASSLVASMTLGYVFLRKRYSLVRVISVIAVTIGIALATLASSKSANVHSNDEYLVRTPLTPRPLATLVTLLADVDDLVVVCGNSAACARRIYGGRTGHRPRVDQQQVLQVSSGEHVLHCA